MVLGCGVTDPAMADDDGSDDGKADSPDGSTVTASNVLPVTIDRSSSAQNIPEVTVTVCVPGTKTCQTIPHIEVDTASTGLRVYSAALHIGLPTELDGDNRIGDCAWNYWGYMHMADVQLAGLKAKAIPIQVIEPGDPNTPSWCGADTAYNPSTYNGIIGISPTLTDTMATGYYYSCSAQGCTQGGIDPSLQVANVSANFPTDNNGCVVQFPDVPADGTQAVTGQVIFGIGTRSNNHPPSDLVPIVPDETWGQFKVEANGKIYESAFDSGTWSYNVPYLSNELCPNDTVRLCPSSPLTIPVDLLNANGDVTYLTSMNIVDYSKFPSANMAFDNLGTAWPGSTQMMFGLPYFFGRSIYYGYDQRNTPVGVGPWIGVPTTIAPNQWYRIENVAMSLSLDDEVIDASGNYSGQAWRIESLPDGYMRLTNEFKGTGQSLDTANDGVYEPAMRPTGNYSGQLWRITPAGNGTFRLTNEFRGTGNSLEADSDGSLHMAANKPSSSQYWSIVPF
jgi:hypothetical protein